MKKKSMIYLLATFLALFLTCSISKVEAAGRQSCSEAMVIVKDLELRDAGLLKKDIYILEDAALTITGDMTLKGKMYVFGELYIDGCLHVDEIFCLNYNNQLRAGGYDQGFVCNRGGLIYNDLHLTSMLLDVKVPEITHHSYWQQDASMKENEFELICALCGVIEGRGYKMNDEKYYLQDSQTTSKHKVYDADGYLLEKEKCSYGDWEVYKKATATVAGAERCYCSCGRYKSRDIYKITLAELSSEKMVYDGYKNVPDIRIKNEKGTKLIEGIDYTYKIYNQRGARVTAPKAVGTYTIKITYEGNYAGVKKMSYTIVPKAVGNVKAVLTPLYGYNHVKLTWTAPKGATGYRVFYKKNSEEVYEDYKDVTGTEASVYALASGTKYNFKIVPYYGKNKILSTRSTTRSVTTLKRVTKVTVVRKGTSVTVSWGNIEGETGYQISRSLSSSGTANIASYGGASLKTKTFQIPYAVKYYYKVRAYKTVDGEKVYGPWSSAIYK